MNFFKKMEISMKKHHGVIDVLFELTPREIQ